MINPSTEDLTEALYELLIHAETNYCTHEEALYRGGSIWTICRDCGKQWADDMGGVPKDVHELPKAIKKAQKILKAIKIKK